MKKLSVLFLVMCMFSMVMPVWASSGCRNGYSRPVVIHYYPKRKKYLSTDDDNTQKIKRVRRRGGSSSVYARYYPVPKPNFGGDTKIKPAPVYSHSAISTTGSKIRRAGAVRRGGHSGGMSIGLNNYTGGQPKPVYSFR